MTAYRNRSAAPIWNDPSMLQSDETIILLPRRHRSSTAPPWYDRSMLQGDEMIFLIPPDQSRHPSAAAPWYDCSMLQGDETIFLVPRDQSRRFVNNGHDRPPVRDSDRNQGFPPNGNASERRRMIAEHIGSKVVRDQRDGDDDGVCVICQENLVAENRKIARLDCGHHYHQRCITTWLYVKNTCPLCQTTVV